MNNYHLTLSKPDDHLLLCPLESGGGHQEKDRAGGHTEGQFQPPQAPERGERGREQEQPGIGLQIRAHKPPSKRCSPWITGLWLFGN